MAARARPERGAPRQRPARPEPLESLESPEPPERFERPERLARSRQAPPRSPRRGGVLGLSSTRRAVILALVVGALALSVAVPLRNYLGQRGELTEVQQQQERLRQQVDGLEQRKQELSDPAQVEAEARRRLRYVRPGETPYIVQLPEQSTSPPTTGGQPAEQPQPWYSDLWRSAASPSTAPGASP